MMFVSKSPVSCAAGVSDACNWASSLARRCPSLSKFAFQLADTAQQHHHAISRLSKSDARMHDKQPACSTRSTSRASGTGICLLAIKRSKVDLPLPLGPTKPYRRPAVTPSCVFSNSNLPLARTDRLCTCARWWCSGANSRLIFAGRVIDGCGDSLMFVMSDV